MTTKNYKYFTLAFRNALSEYIRHHPDKEIINIVPHKSGIGVNIICSNEEIHWYAGIPIEVEEFCKEVLDYLGIVGKNSLVSRFEKYFKNVKIVERKE